LWSAWLAQDAANALVFLPRVVSAGQFAAVLVFMLAALGYIFYRRGGEIQKVVTEKTDVLYVKSATTIDFVYGLILVYFKMINDLPMSTTWVFLGLLAGREIALRIMTHKDKPYSHTLKLVQNDLLRAGFGLGVSLALALLINGAAG
jgi:amino acid transporter